MNVLIAELDGRVAGTLTVTFLPSLTRNVRPYGVVENVVTDWSCRRQGVARALLNAADSLAQDRGAYKLMLMTGTSLTDAHALYRACGYDDHTKVAFEKRDP